MQFEVTIFGAQGLYFGVKRYLHVVPTGSAMELTWFGEIITFGVKIIIFGGKFRFVVLSSSKNSFCEVSKNTPKSYGIGLSPHKFPLWFEHNLKKKITIIAKKKMTLKAIIRSLQFCLIYCSWFISTLIWLDFRTFVGSSDLLHLRAFGGELLAKIWWEEAQKHVKDRAI